MGQKNYGHTLANTCFKLETLVIRLVENKKYFLLLIKYFFVCSSDQSEGIGLLLYPIRSNCEVSAMKQWFLEFLSHWFFNTTSHVFRIYFFILFSWNTCLWPVFFFLNIGLTIGGLLINGANPSSFFFFIESAHWAYSI